MTKEENINNKLKSYLTSREELLPNEKVIRETDLDFLAESLNDLSLEDVQKNKEALKVLTDHQKWRLGDDSVEATNPKELTKAIDLAIKLLKK